ncbi:unnamed protein product [Gulo gulo]|uniref:Uncharacterized protein n=1 Tax=Gulo gulo TaxID=48420 RepID=A0A9X9PT43_GULGU|nr:unnamed protein product [Gulo gulo]
MAVRQTWYHTSPLSFKALPCLCGSGSFHHEVELLPPTGN